MPDITMCENEKCVKRLNCYRFVATPSPLRQTYFLFESEQEKEEWKDGCENFWDINDK